MCGRPPWVGTCGCRPPGLLPWGEPRGAQTVRRGSVSARFLTPAPVAAGRRSYAPAQSGSDARGC
jgi:hypothetical protein